MDYSTAPKSRQQEAKYEANFLFFCSFSYPNIFLRSCSFVAIEECCYPAFFCFILYTPLIISTMIKRDTERSIAQIQCVAVSVVIPKNCRNDGVVNGRTCRENPAPTARINHVFSNGFDFQNGVVSVRMENT